MLLKTTMRRHLRRLSRTWIRHPVYFVTICAAGRRRVLDRPPAVAILQVAWRVAPNIHGWVVGRYVVMPDHVRFITTAEPEAKSLSDFVRDWKKWTTRRMVEVGLATAPVWQAEFFDHLLRSTSGYAAKWDYVRENPVRAGLVSSAEQWPFAGEFEVFRL